MQLGRVGQSHVEKSPVTKPPPQTTLDLEPRFWRLTTRVINNRTTPTLSIWKLEKKFGIPSSRVMLKNLRAAPMGIHPNSVTSASNIKMAISTVTRPGINHQSILSWSIFISKDTSSHKGHQVVPKSNRFLEHIGYWMALTIILRPKCVNRTLPHRIDRLL